jgi:hypothetical protein
MFTVIQNSFEPKTQKRCKYLKSLKFGMQRSPIDEQNDAVVLKMNNNQLA